MRQKLMALTAMLAMAFYATGCFTVATASTETKNPDGTYAISKVKVLGTGDKASEVAADGLFADGDPGALGAGVEKAKAKQESTGVEGTIAAMGNLMSGMAQFMVAVRSPNGEYSIGAGLGNTSSPVAAAPADSTQLRAKQEEAKSLGKTLIVIAGNPQCGYCRQFDEAFAASGIAQRNDVIVYNESSPWASNAALSWTGGGNAPIVRVTKWNDQGGIVCNEKLNRPSVAQLTSALSTCTP